MSTILNSIFVSCKDNPKILKRNNEFFSKYLDKDVLVDLIEIREIYLQIIYLSDNRIEEKLRRYLLKYKELKKEKIICLKSKAEIIKGLTNDSSIDLIKQDEKVNSQLKEIIKCLNETTNNFHNLKQEQKNIQEQSDMQDKLNDKLIKILKRLKGKENRISLSCEQKKKYSDSIKDIFKSEKAMKCYVTYLFELINNDMDSLQHVFSSAQNYVLDLEKTSDHKEDNDSIVLEHIINKNLNIFLNNFVDSVNNCSLVKLNEISDENLQNKTIINMMIHLAKNYENLNKDKEVLKSEYQMILNMINDVKDENKKKSDNSSLSSIIIKIFDEINDRLGSELEKNNLLLKVM